MFGYFGPTDLPPGGTGRLNLDVFNGGGRLNVSPVVVVDRLPVGLIATGGSGCVVSDGGRVVSCEVGGVGPAYTPTLVRISVSVARGASGVAVDEVEASGGGALGVSRSSVPVVFSAKAAGVGIANFDGWFTNVDGTADTQAGSHPYAAFVAMAFNESLNGGEEEPTAGEGPRGELLHGEPRGIDVKVPPGLVGDPKAVGQCSRELFDNSEIGERNGEGCPASSAVGLVELSAKGVGSAGDPVFNLVPPHGVAAEFGFSVRGGLNVFLNARVRSGGDYGITEEVKRRSANPCTSVSRCGASPRKKHTTSIVVAMDVSRMMWGVAGRASRRRRS